MVQEVIQKKKNANIELLRIISMLMVTTLHALGKSGLLRRVSLSDPVNGSIAWVLEVLSICAVNVFMLISGYFLLNSEFRLRRWLEIIFQTLFYSLVPFLVCFALGIVKDEDLSIYGLLNYFAPIHTNTYWFMSAYVITYLFAPFLAAGIKTLEKKQVQTVIACLLVIACLFKSVLPFRFVIGGTGYDFFWYCIMFLLGAYFRKYGFQKLNSSAKGILVYLGACILILAETGVVSLLKEKTGRFKDFLSSTRDYNQLFVLIAAIGLFAAFLHAKPLEGKVAKLICALSPLALGVYLFQENLQLREEWQKWFGLPESLADPTYLFVLRILVAVFGMLILGMTVDALRTLLFKAIKKSFNPKKEIVE